jgi:hypothetical protein
MKINHKCNYNRAGAYIQGLPYPKCDRKAVQFLYTTMVDLTQPSVDGKPSPQIAFRCKKHQIKSYDSTIWECITAEEAAIVEVINS